jgi:putative ABC transport system substrate-binding protein
VEKSGRIRKDISGRMMNESFKRIANGLRTYIPFNKGIYCSVVLILFILTFLSLFIPSTLLAREDKGVIILNSDMSIYKYSLAQSELKSKITHLKGEIDLGSKWIDEKKIKKMILDVNPDIIYCIGSKAYQMAYKLAGEKNIVFSLVVNWRRHPIGKGTYGISNEPLQGIQLMMYRYFFPDVSKIGILYNKTYNKEWFDIAVESAKDVGISIIGKSISKPDKIESALNKLLPKVDALWLIPDPIVIYDIESVNKLFGQCQAAGKPIYTYDKAFADLGATLIMSADIPTMIRQSAEIVFSILEGRKIEEKVQNPAGSHIMLNMKKVEEYGLNLNIEALDSVNEMVR